MNYIGLLTKEEKAILCKIITGAEFKELFKKNEQDFLKIQKGFRAKSLTEQRALSIAIANIDELFIATWVNIRVEHWLKEIQENITKLEEEGFSHGAALATTLLDSFFVNNIELYFKLIENTLTADACANLYERMEDIKSERARSVEASDRIKAIEEENRHLSDQIETVQRSFDAIKAEYEESFQKNEQDKNKLASLLAEAQAKIDELQTAPSVFTGNEVDQLAQFDDTDTNVLPTVGNNEIVSLCSVTSDYSGQKWLTRHADLSHDGYYHVFHKNEYLPAYFTNRDKLFYKDGPSADGTYGIWTWSASPNDKDPSKDYILSKYNMDIDAIEVVTISAVSNLDDLISMLKKGIESKAHSRRVMLAFYASKGKYVGVLCNAKELVTVNEKISISGECDAIPVYEFSGDDIIRLDNGLSFYRNAFAGLPRKLYHLKSPLDIAKSIVLSSISWNACKAREITRAEYRMFKDFIDAIPVDDVTCKIEVACHCSHTAAEELLNKVLNVVWKYVDGDSLEDDIVRSSISANTDLQEKTKSLIRKDWEMENEELLAKARQELDSLRAELKAATESLNEAQKSLAKTQAEEQQLSDVIAQKGKLAEDVEIAVNERIQEARKNAAEFIASMAFVSGQQVQDVRAVTPTLDDDTHQSQLDMATYYAYPKIENSDDLEVHHSWGDVINTAIYELTEAGVAEQYRSGLAAFLCAAYIEKQPLLLVGPNAIDIARAFCAAVTAHKHGTLYCEGGCVRQAIEKIGADDEDIVIINNLLAGGWMNRLPEILCQKDIFYIATHPYAEDIQVEPKSLYSFMLPLFTEFLVDKKATGKYYGGYFSDDFKPYSAGKSARKELTALSKLGLSSLIRSKINSLMTTMHNIYPSATTDDDFLLFIFPIAYASMAINELKVVIADPQKSIEISANLKRDLQHVLGEN